MADPNWFYSTIAQSTAAIVGLGGGFLVQRLLQQRNEIGARRGELRAQLHTEWLRLEDLKASLLNAAAELRDIAQEAGRQLDAGAETFRVSQTFHAYNHKTASIVGIANGLPGALRSEWATRFEEAAFLTRQIAQELPNTFDQFVDVFDRRGDFDYPLAVWLMDDLAPSADTELPNPALDAVYRSHDHLLLLWRDFHEIRTQARDELNAVKNTLVPRRTYWMLGTLALLLIGGAIIPLAYLSARDDSSKLPLMVVFAVFSLAFLAFIAAELRSLRNAGDMKRETY